MEAECIANPTRPSSLWLDKPVDRIHCIERFYRSISKVGGLRRISHVSMLSDGEASEEVNINGYCQLVGPVLASCGLADSFDKALRKPARSALISSLAGCAKDSIFS